MPDSTATPTPTSWSCSTPATSTRLTHLLVDLPVELRGGVRFGPGVLLSRAAPIAWRRRAPFRHGPEFAPAQPSSHPDSKRRH